MSLKQIYSTFWIFYLRQAPTRRHRRAMMQTRQVHNDTNERAASEEKKNRSLDFGLDATATAAAAATAVCPMKRELAQLLLSMSLDRMLLHYITPCPCSFISTLQLDTFAIRTIQNDKNGM